jgi:hypothetical protein
MEEEKIHINDIKVQIRNIRPELDTDAISRLCKAALADESAEAVHEAMEETRDAMRSRKNRLRTSMIEFRIHLEVKVLTFCLQMITTVSMPGPITPENTITMDSYDIVRDVTAVWNREHSRYRVAELPRDPYWPIFVFKVRDIGATQPLL